jgi:hypothetical protein
MLTPAQLEREQAQVFWRAKEQWREAFNPGNRNQNRQFLMK